MRHNLSVADRQGERERTGGENIRRGKERMKQDLPFLVGHWKGEGNYYEMCGVGDGKGRQFAYVNKELVLIDIADFGLAVSQGKIRPVEDTDADSN